MIALFHGIQGDAEALVIERVSWGVHTHAAFIHPVTLAKYEATTPTVQRVPSINDGQPAGRLVDIFGAKTPYTQDQLAKLTAFYESQRGKRYSYEGMINCGLHIEFKNADSSPDQPAWICSEYVSYGHRLIDLDLIARIFCWKQLPEDLYGSAVLEHLGMVRLPVDVSVLSEWVVEKGYV